MFEKASRTEKQFITACFFKAGAGAARILNEDTWGYLRQRPHKMAFFVTLLKVYLVRATGHKSACKHRDSG